MKPIAIIASGLLVLVGTVSFAHGSYNSNNNNNNGYSNKEAQAAHGYPAGGSGYQQAGSSYGPYHSYAVRPALYGGYGLYSYRGYARHYPAPPVTGKSYSNGNGNGNGYGSGNGNGAYGSSHAAAAPLYGMKPIKALLLVPEPAHKAISYSSNNNNNNNYSQNRGYGAPARRPAGKSYGRKRTVHAPRLHYGAPYRANRYSGASSGAGYRRPRANRHHGGAMRRPRHYSSYGNAGAHRAAPHRRPMHHYGGGAAPYQQQTSSYSYSDNHAPAAGSYGAPAAHQSSYGGSAQQAYAAPAHQSQAGYAPSNY